MISLDLVKFYIFILLCFNNDIQSTLDIVTLDLREIRYKRQIFGAPAVPIGDIMLSPFEIREFDIREFSI